MTEPVRVLAIAGSLRDGSFNRHLLRHAQAAAPAGVEVELLDGLDQLPHYDDDLDAAGAAGPAVEELRQRVRSADGLLIATPEYNGSVPGVLKNAIDWLSRPRGSAPLAGANVAIVGASTGAYGALWAQQDLRRILGIAGARVVGEPLPVARAHDALGGDSITPQLRAELVGRLELLRDEARISLEARQQIA